MRRICHSVLNVINTLQRTNIKAIEDDLAFELVPILLDMVVLNHDDYHIYIVDELIEVAELVLCNLMVFQNGS